MTRTGAGWCSILLPSKAESLASPVENVAMPMSTRAAPTSLWMSPVSMCRRFNILNLLLRYIWRFRIRGHTPNHPSHQTIQVMKLMVTWGSTMT